ncbi:MULTISPECIES: flagellar biosynthetic protein FliR [unclassified Undibacterium]|uniref:flagellar biosynthetic protein FliR n=1 Tax=unclassified Undibacterium TaxID=2630295 RepID=UPI002AC8F75A|nr:MULTISPECIES: flagellar biosynthetic protein FliR [unclassified Undibacterium]MEB0139867.1 flagellar biosynthetic protein FliR [Undibacterium sp. CCC2.1]MEB0172797.1 flagellar biosynthetic protein FliR [Undibacterium sp. CCC1.1]MEB0176589.1 flagellar biosynthetic protein FliR [Undibacterium sp. CCC3.4]MEB0215821.1 flagellar biosynthetic protein FliR [Undibacterium sp. 5I2]WPX42672.1 flagellar biosynthetic protein FliR [Undibacterium sp. CCC3.4]
MISFTSNELLALLTSFLWPLTRILGLIAIAPPFGNSSIPVQVKLALGVMIALIVAPTMPALPGADPMSLTGIMILAQQLVIGLGMGFVMRLVFAAIELAGELSATTMGLGFASFFDPQTQGRSSALSQFLVLIATLLFFTLNIHIALISALIESFKTIPISTTLQSGFNFYQLTLWGEQIFMTGLRLALPIVAALLLTNVALGILTRAAPQLNLFGIGFPITIGVGFLMLALILPYLAMPMENLFHLGLDTILNLKQAIPKS